MNRETETVRGLPALSLPQLRKKDPGGDHESIESGGGREGVGDPRPRKFGSEIFGAPSVSATVLGIVTLATAIYAFRILYRANYFGEMHVSGNTVLADTLFVDSTSRTVGIGSVSSQERLLVDGTSRFTGNVTIGSTVFVTGPPQTQPSSFDGVVSEGRAGKRNELIQGSLSILGDVTIVGLLTADRASFFNIDAQDYYSIRNVMVLNSTSLGNGIVHSSLKRVGTLDFLDVTNDFTVGIADFVVNTDTGRVGINTSDPMETLDVVGTLGVSEKILTDFIEAENGTLSLGCGEETEVVNIGVSTSHPKVVNIGSSNGLVNIHGNVFSSQATNLEVTDKNITLNDGGLLGSAGNAGLEISEGGSTTAFIKIHPDRDRWVLKAPENAEAVVLTSNGPQFVSNGEDVYYQRGNVGLGVSNPRSRLEVVGDIRLAESDGVYFDELAGLTVDTLGPSIKNSSLENVGVLTELTVSGNIKTLGNYWVQDSRVLDKISLGETVVESNLQKVGLLNELSVLGNIQAKSHIYNTGMAPGNGVPLAIDSAGKIVKVASSLRYKTNVRRLSAVISAEEVISKLYPVVFEYKNVPGEIVYGLIAEEVEKIDPSLVTYNQQGVVDGIQYMQLIPFLIEEVKKIPKLTQELDFLRRKYTERDFRG